MNCPFCQHPKTEVYNSRQSGQQSHIWRRRRCKQCNSPFTTYEVPDMRFIKVSSPEGNERPYQRTKLIFSLWSATGDEDDTIDDVEALADTIESKILSDGHQAISTQTISDIALATLKHYDPTVFMRYLSQRGDFASLERLRKELQEI